MMKLFRYRIFLLLPAVILISRFVLAQATDKPNGLIVLITDYQSKNADKPPIEQAIGEVFPNAKVDSISHPLSTFTVKEGAYTLQRAGEKFPHGTVFVVLFENAGEGKPIALKTKKGSYFIAPNNGILTRVARAMGVSEVREITNPKLIGQTTPDSASHRQVNFFSVAAQLAKQSPFEEVGALLEEYLQLPFEFATVVDGEIVGHISEIESEFGNAATNISTDLFTKLKWQRGDTLEADFSNEQKIRFPYVLKYGDVPVGDYLGRFDDTTGFFKVAINRGNIGETLKLEGRNKVVIRKVAKVIDGEIIGQINLIDEYGHAVTNITADDFTEVGWQRGDTLEVEFENRQKIRCPYVLDYDDVPVGDYLGRFGSTSRLFKVAINYGKIAEVLKLESLSKVVIRKVE